MKNRFSLWHRWYIFAICAIMYIASCFWRVSNAVVAGDLSRDLGLSPETLGLLGGAFFYGFGLAQLPMGPLLDRFGSRAVVGLLACIGAISATGFALSGNGATAILARAGIGIGMAPVLMGSYKIFTTWFSPHRFATLSGSLISFGSLGAIAATTPLAWLSEAVGWRDACLYMAAITFLLAVAMYVVVRDRPPQQAGILPQPHPSMSDIFSGLRAVFGSSLFWRLAPLGFASYGTLITAQGLWGGPYLMHTYGMTKTAASSVLAAIPVGLICGGPLWGHWSDRLGRRKLPTLLVLGAMLLVFSSLALNLQLPRWGLVLQCWLLGLTGAGGFLLYAQVKETFPLSIAGTSLAALNFFVIFGAASLQHMMGIILDNWQPSITGALPVEAYQWGFGVSAAFLAMALALYTISRDTGPRSAHGLLQ